MAQTESAIRPRHPEQEDDEVSLGSMTEKVFNALDLKTKRKSTLVRNRHDDTFAAQEGIVSVFVKRTEVEGLLARSKAHIQLRVLPVF